MCSTHVFVDSPPENEQFVFMFSFFMIVNDDVERTHKKSFNWNFANARDANVLSLSERSDDDWLNDSFICVFIYFFFNILPSGWWVRLSFQLLEGSRQFFRDCSIKQSREMPAQIAKEARKKRRENSVIEER